MPKLSASSKGLIDAQVAAMKEKLKAVNRGAIENYNHGSGDGIEI